MSTVSLSGIHAVRPAVAFGALLGAMLVALLLLETFTGWYHDPVMIRIRMLNPAVLLLVLAAAVWHMARRSWLERLGGGVATVLFAALFYGLATYIVVGVLFPDYLDTMQEMHRQGLMAQGKSTTEIADTLARHRHGVFREAMNAAMLVAVPGTVLAIVLSAVVRRKAAL